MYIFRAQTLGLALQRKTKKKKNLRRNRRRYLRTYYSSRRFSASSHAGPRKPDDPASDELRSGQGHCPVSEERINHCRTNMSSALSVFLRGCQHLSKKRWRYWSNHKPSSHGERGTLAVGVPDTTAISELGQEGSEDV